EKWIPSKTVGLDLKVLNTSFACMPFVKGVYRFGSKVSVCAIPPDIYNKITESALDAILFLLHEVNRVIGAPMPIAAIAAALVFFINSLLFQSLPMDLLFNVLTLFFGA